MNTEKNQLVVQSPAQSDPNLCDPRDFDVIEAGDAAKMSTPFHNQCGSTEREYRKLLREGEEAANASDLDEKRRTASRREPGRHSSHTLNPTTKLVDDPLKLVQ